LVRPRLDKVWTNYPWQFARQVTVTIVSPAGRFVFAQWVWGEFVGKSKFPSLAGVLRKGSYRLGFGIVVHDIEAIRIVLKSISTSLRSLLRSGRGLAKSANHGCKSGCYPVGGEGGSLESLDSAYGGSCRTVCSSREISSPALRRDPLASTPVTGPAGGGWCAGRSAEPPGARSFLKRTGSVDVEFAQPATNATRCHRLCRQRR